jgi:hypothetical protein
VSRQVKGWSEQEVGDIAQNDGEESLEEIDQHKWVRRQGGPVRIRVYAQRFDLRSNGT